MAVDLHTTDREPVLANVDSGLMLTATSSEGAVVALKVPYKATRAHLGFADQYFCFNIICNHLGAFHAHEISAEKVNMREHVLLEVASAAFALAHIRCIE
ncbi:hypothetical protein MUCCIDRAFT_104742 [Mucor lusitanicus CBS 277.49]|uniref:Uncharacterized protein n=1 Tax=Mucor lusitanicus CBS 277.49 TaxID=747725 RepID=A0A162TX01_MUCCL|nr:hypothetical protein MUCCIDRAFT_104742 [Mucor lusitanicus CBS 277.49]